MSALPVNSISSTSAIGSDIIGNIAMMASFHTSMPKQTKKEKQVSQNVNDAHGVAYRMGRYYKSLYDPDDLAKVQAVVSAAKAFHYDMTMPWLDKGPRLLPTVGYISYVTRFRQFKADHQVEVDAFVKDFSRKLQNLPKLLGTLFNAADYPDQSEIRNCFDLDVRFAPVPKGDDFRVTGIASATVKQMQQQIDKDAKLGLQTAMDDVWGRIAERVGKMVEALKTYQPAHTDEHGAKRRVQGGFHGTLVTNIRDLVELLPILNVTKDPKLTEISEAMRQELCLFEADDLKSDETVRTTVAAQAEQILAQVSQYIA